MIQLHAIYKDLPLVETHRLRVKWWKKRFHANSIQKRVRVDILITDKTDNTKIAPRDKKGHHIMINMWITDINIYALNNITPKYIKQNLRELKREIYNPVILVGDFNTPFSIIELDRKSARKQKTWPPPCINWI